MVLQFYGIIANGFTKKIYCINAYLQYSYCNFNPVLAYLNAYATEQMHSSRRH